MKNSCLVLEGGGLRGAFTSGVLEYLLEKEINFDRVIGVSAGACVGASYQSKQKGRNRKVNVEYPSDKRYMGVRHLFTTGSYFNMKFIFGELPGRLVPFDEQAFFNNRAEFDVVTTSMGTGGSVVFTKSEIANIGVGKALVASSSIPLLSQPVGIGGQLFFDGGVSDSIPVKYALGKHEKAVVVLTRPRGYRKGPMRFTTLLKFVFRKHPQFLEALLKRNERYNKTLDFCGQMEREGKLFIIAPSPEFSIGRTEKSLKKRMDLYNHGYALITKEFENLQLFLDQDTIFKMATQS
jgi:predicted patatin/cPLA2 family phospholipase